MNMEIGDYAFSGCVNLKSVTIPDSVTKIGNSTFKGCCSLTSVTIPNSVTSIGGSAFSWCIGLTSIIIPNSVTEIGDYAFEDCSGLTSVTIPNGVTEISEGAFSGCSGLTSVTVPNSTTNIGCYDNQIDKLKFPLKLVSASYSGTYEDCAGRSYGDPNQGFTRGYWNQVDYQKYYKLLKSVEKEREDAPHPSMLHFSERLKVSKMYSKWLKDVSTDTYSVKDCPLNVVTFLLKMGWLNEEKMREDLKGVTINESSGM